MSRIVPLAMPVSSIPAIRLSHKDIGVRLSAAPPEDLVAHVPHFSDTRHQPRACSSLCAALTGRDIDTRSHLALCSEFQGAIWPCYEDSTRAAFALLRPVAFVLLTLAAAIAR